MTPLTVTSAPSTTCSDEIASPWKLGSPGVSMRLIFRPCHSTWHRDAEIDISRCCSSSSQSETVVPCSTTPSRFVAPRLEEHRLDERGLAGAAMTDDGDVADLSGLDCGHAGAPPGLVSGDLSEASVVERPPRFWHEAVTHARASPRYARSGEEAGRALKGATRPVRARARRRGAPSGAGPPSCAAARRATR